MSHPEPPVWLLDVDGVINAYRGGWYTSPHIVQMIPGIPIFACSIGVLRHGQPVAGHICTRVAA